MIDVRSYNASGKLRDGRSLLVRSVTPDDKADIFDGFSLFSEKSLYRRFHGTKSGLTDQDLKFYTEIDYLYHVALLAMLEENGQIIGGGRYISFNKAMPPRTAEVAFAVADRFQGMGAGTIILMHLIRIAREVGIREFEADVLVENMAMIRVFEKSGLPMTRTREGMNMHIVMTL